MNRMKRYFLSIGVALVCMLTIFGFSPKANAQYCIPTNPSGCQYQDYIQSFSFANIANNLSGCNNQTNGYQYYNALTANTLAGSTYNYSFTLTPSYPEGVAIWADYNGNGVFETSERFYASAATLAAGSTVTGTTTVPANATPGTWRLRIRCGYATAGVNIDPCNNTATGEGESEDYNIQILSGSITNSWPGGTNFPGISASGLVLEVGYVFDGSSNMFPKPSLLVDRINVTGYNQKVTYTILAENVSGIDQNTEMYAMRDPNNLTSKVIDIPQGPGAYTYTAQAASGPMARIIPTNDGTFTTVGFPGGTYKVVATHDLLFGTTVVASQTWTKIFNLAVNRDIAVSSIESPLPSRRQSYLGSVPIRARYMNVGLETIARYRAYYEIRNSRDGSLIKMDSLERSTDQGGGLDTAGLKTAVIDEVQFPSFAVATPDSFCIVLKAKLLETKTNQFAVDQQTANDRMPSTDCAYKFRMWYLNDFEAKSLQNPGSALLYAGRPIKPLAIIANNGLNADGIPVQMTATLNGTVIATQTITVEVPTGSYNVAPAIFDEFTPPQPGNLEICIQTIAPGDQFAPNDKQCYTFTINDRMNGNYTVGTVPKSGIENFGTIDAAVNALYTRGIRGPVNFYLTDANYQVGDVTNVGAPALDLTSTILGAGSNAPIRFTPDSTSVGLLRGGVTIQLRSGNGIGVLFGQSLTPSNPNAVYRQFPSKANANSAGYITFDGGAQKSFRFRLYTGSNRKAVFYMGQRSNNISIMNNLIENDPSTPETEYWSAVPLISIDQSNLLFAKDSIGSGATLFTFSAGIAQRNVPPADEFGSNRAGLDTAIVENNITYRGNKQNKIVNNEITGFGIGVMSLGIGTLKERNKLVRYYNTGTEIVGNKISKVGRTGIFIGYEDGAKISKNKVYNVLGYYRRTTVTGTSTFIIESNGIEVGCATDTTTTNQGYNNINTEISYNEVNDVASYFISRGINVNQSQNNYSATGILENTLQPSVNENTKVFGNLVFGLSRGINFNGSKVFNTAVHRIGIQLTTDRQTGQAFSQNLGNAWSLTQSFTTQAASLTTPRTSFNPAKNARAYFTRGDIVANNTVLIQDDSLSTRMGTAVGIAIQNSFNAVMTNNAVAVTQPLNATSLFYGFPYSAYFYQGLLPIYSGGLSSNRNVAWTSQPTGFPTSTWTKQGAFMRFVEIDTLSQVLLGSCQDEFNTRDQWYNWTGQDKNSFEANFVASSTDSLLLIGQYPVVSMRQKRTVGSIINNAGERLSYVTQDIDGEPRGTAQNPYDIGADEFNGIPYVNDVEVLTITAPRAYKSGTCTYGGPFSDVEYVTADTSSVPVMVRLRNNSTLSQTISLTGTYAMESAATSGNAVATYGVPSPIGTISVIIGAGETRDVKLGDVSVQTLSTLGTAYTSPTWMQSAVDATMRPNVTPRYEFTASFVNGYQDENNSNNAFASQARFYVRQSNVSKFMISVLNSGFDHKNTLPTAPNYANNAVGRMNTDSLRTALDSLGFFSDPTKLVPNDKRVYRYDILDRTGWEARSFDYTPYKMLLWSEDNTLLLRTERDQLRAYLASGSSTLKKNLIISTQNVVSNHVGLNATNDEFFVNNQLRSSVVRNGAAIVTTPVAAGYTPTVVALGQSFIDGVFVQRGLSELIKTTGFVNGTYIDPAPRPSLMRIFTNAQSQGLSRVAFRYRTTDAGIADTAMGVATTSTNWNVINYGIDWRHFAKSGQRTGLERVLRGSFDYIQFNAGKVTPVELVEFDARKIGKSVSIDWSTASESNSAWYEVEKAEKVAGNLEFERIETVPAAGNSTSRRDYNTVDMNVRNGSSYIYRLRMVDRDGSFKYSDEVAVVIGDVNSNLSISESRPNPVSGIASFDYSVQNSGLVTVVLTDMMGREISTIFSGNINAGTHTLEVSSSDLASGVYQIIVKSGDSFATRSIQVVK